VTTGLVNPEFVNSWMIDASFPGPYPPIFGEGHEVVPGKCSPCNMRQQVEDVEVPPHMF